MYAPSFGMITGTAIGSGSLGVERRRSRDEHELDVAALRLPLPRLADAIERQRLGVEADAGRRPRARPRPRSPARARRAARRSSSSRAARAASRARSPTAAWRSAPPTARGGRSALPGPATAERGLERRPAERVEHERRRRAVDRGREPLAEVVAVERDGGVGAELARGLEPGLRRGRRRRHAPRRAASPPARRPSRRCRSRRARARPRPAAPARATTATSRPRGRPGPSAAATRSEAASGHLDQRLVGDGEALRERAVARDAEPAARRPDARPAAKRADCDDPADALDPGHVRKRRAAGREAPRRDREIGRVERGGEQLDDRLALGRLAARAARRPRAAPVRGDDRGAHGLAGARPRRRA